MSDVITRAAAAFAPGTFNREKGTVDAVLSTGAPVRRSGFIEKLDIGRDAVATHGNIPVLDSHRQTSIADVLGRVDGIRFEPGQIVATLRITSPAALDAIERGDISGVSIGYRVEKWSDATDAAGSRTRTATRWTLMEASLVPIPADTGATFRSQEVTTETTTTTVTAPVVITRAQTNNAIRSLAKTLGLPRKWSDTQIDAEVTIDAARAAALVELETRAVGEVRTQHMPLTTDTGFSHRAEAIAHRMAGLPLTDASRPYQHHRLIDHARDALHAAQISTVGMSPDAILKRAMETTSDFPNLLTTAGNRTLAAPYAAAASPTTQVFKKSTVPDFRPKSRLSLSEAAQLLPVNEGGEIKTGSRGESIETYTLMTFARIFSLSRNAIINDDLGAFGDWAAEMGQAAAESENVQRVKLLRSNPNLHDESPMFSSGHGNLASGAAVQTPTVLSLSAARQAMRLQKGLDGVTPANNAPKFLLVGPMLETVSEQILHELSAVDVQNVNPFGGSLTLLVEPRFGTSLEWYVFTDPAARPCFEESHLTGAPGPQLASRQGWDVLGIEYRVYLDYGCGPIDFRGAYKNPGQ